MNCTCYYTKNPVAKTQTGTHMCRYLTLHEFIDTKTSLLSKTSRTLSQISFNSTMTVTIKRIHLVTQSAWSRVLSRTSYSFVPDKFKLQPTCCYSRLVELTTLFLRSPLPLFPTPLARPQYTRKKSQQTGSLSIYYPIAFKNSSNTRSVRQVAKI